MVYIPIQQKADEAGMDFILRLKQEKKAAKAEELFLAAQTIVMMVCFPLAVVIAIIICIFYLN